MEVLQHWGQHKGEVRYRLRQYTLPCPGRSRVADLVMTRTHLDTSMERCVENGVRCHH